MKTSRLTEEQIAFVIKQHELGPRVKEICRKLGISDATFYKCGGSMPILSHRSLKSRSRKTIQTRMNSNSVSVSCVLISEVDPIIKTDLVEV